MKQLVLFASFTLLAGLSAISAVSAEETPSNCISRDEVQILVDQAIEARLGPKCAICYVPVGSGERHCGSSTGPIWPSGDCLKTIYL